MVDEVAPDCFFSRCRKRHDAQKLYGKCLNHNEIRLIRARRRSTIQGLISHVQHVILLRCGITDSSCDAAAPSRGVSSLDLAARPPRAAFFLKSAYSAAAWPGRIGESQGPAAETSVSVKRRSLSRQMAKPGAFVMRASSR
jgi:hypothetical protein